MSCACVMCLLPCVCLCTAVDTVKEANRALNWTAHAAPVLRDGMAQGVISPARLVTMASGARRCVLTAGKGNRVMP